MFKRISLARAVAVLALGSLAIQQSIAALCLGALLGTSATAAAVMHVRGERTLTIMLNAPPDVAFPAFGPAAEQGWNPSWHPSYLYPSQAEDREGAVFTTGNDRPQTWLLQTWDMSNRIVRYVAFDPDIKLTVLTITVSPASAGHSQARIVFARTGLSSAGDAQIRSWAEHVADDAPRLEAEVNSYLAKPH